jgi:hypothetical protein
MQNSPAPEDIAQELMEPEGRQLLLFSRQGCCLCQGLEEKLRALLPPPQLLVHNVDADPALLARYNLEVPVLAIQQPGGGWRELPRLPPRLAGEGLRLWLQRQGWRG